MESNQRLILVFGSSKTVSASDSYRCLGLNHADPKRAQIHCIEYTDFMETVATSPVLCKDCVVIAPQTADLSPELDAIRKTGLLNLHPERGAVFQGSAPGYGNPYDSSTSPEQGVNLPGNEALLRRLQAEGLAMVVNSELCAQFFITPEIYTALDLKEKATIVATVVFQVCSRPMPMLPFAPGLISNKVKFGANYRSIGVVFTACTGRPIESIEESEISDHHRLLADRYVGQMNLSAYSTEIQADVYQKMQHIVVAIDLISPGIWAGREEVFINLVRPNIEQKPEFQKIFSVIMKELQNGKVGCIPPMYDEFAMLAYMESLKGRVSLRDVPHDALQSIDYKCFQSMLSIFLDSTNQRCKAPHAMTELPVPPVGAVAETHDVERATIPPLLHSRMVCAA